MLRIMASESLRSSGAAADGKGDAPAVAPAQPCPAAKTCPPPLPARTDGAKVDIDWQFISDREGGRVLKAYVPAAEESKSGVTVATGVDLGARSEDDIDKLDISEDLKKKLKPYALKKKKDAQDKLAESPLELKDDEAKSLDAAVKKPLMDQLVKDYDSSVDAANKADGCKRVHFDQLPQATQTAIASTNFQYGSIKKATPNYWKQVTEQRWADASANLKNFGDAYPTRRKLEAGLMDAALQPPTPTPTPTPAAPAIAPPTPAGTATPPM